MEKVVKASYFTGSGKRGTPLVLLIPHFVDFLSLWPSSVHQGYTGNWVGQLWHCYSCLFSRCFLPWCWDPVHLQQELITLV